MREYHRALTKEELRRMYWDDGLSISDIAEKCGMSMSGIYHLMTVYCIERRSLSVATKHSRREKRSSYLGRKQSQEEISKRVETRLRNHKPKGVADTGRGYLRYTTGENAGRQVHVVMMEEYIGRKLKSNECVHHINGNKQDNRIENLQLMTIGEHSSLHNSKNADYFMELFSGEKSSCSKLTLEQVCEIRLLKTKMSAPKVAKLYGVTTGNIYHIWKNRTWK